MRKFVSRVTLYSSFSAKPSVPLDSLRPKIESVVLITNEYQSLIEDDLEIEELILNGDEIGDDLLDIIDKTGDKLESAFFAVRDKLSSVTKLQRDMDKMKDELKNLEKARDESKVRESRLREQLECYKKNLQTEKITSEELRHNLSLIQFANDDWSAKYYDVDKLNEQLQRQLNLMRDNEVVTSVDNSHQIEKLRNECLRLQCELGAGSKEREELRNEVEELRGKLDANAKECDNLRRSCEYSEQVEIAGAEFEKLSIEYDRVCRQYDILRGEYEHLKRASEHAEDSNDKYENDFVVLQKRDCDEEENLKGKFAALRQENEKLMETVRSMTQKAIEYENERSSLRGYVDECKRLRETVTCLSEELEAANRCTSESKEKEKELDESRDEEIDGLQAEMSKLVQQLSEVWDQLHDEKSSNTNLKEQLRYSENVNAKLSNEVQELQKRCGELENLRINNEELNAARNELQERIRTLEMEKDQLAAAVADHEADTMLTESMRVEELQVRAYNLEEELERKENELREKANDLRAARRYVEELTKTQTNSSDVQLEEMQRSQLRLVSEKDEAENTCLQLQDELQLTRQELEHRTHALHNASEQWKEMQMLLTRTQSELQNTKAELEGLQQCSLEQLQDELQRRMADLQYANEQWSETQTSLALTQSELRDTKDELERLQHSLEPLQRKSLELQQVGEQLRLTQTLLSCTQLELQNAKAELENLRDEQRSQHLVKDVVVKCNYEIEGLQQNIRDLKRENSVLRERCESYYAKYTALYRHANEIIGRARSASDDVVRMVHNLRSQWTQLEEVPKVEVTTQYDENMAEEYVSEIYEKGRRVEIQTYEKLLDEIRTELNGLRSRYAFVKDQLMCKDDECSAEIAAYENMLGHLRGQLAQAENELSFKVEDIKEYKSLIAKLRLQKNVPAVTTDAEVQVDSDAVHSPDSPPTLTKYFDYCKDKVTKSFSEILQPVEQPPDYSNWILPEERDSEYKVLVGTADATPSTFFDRETQSCVSSADATTQLAIHQPEISNQGSQATVVDRDSTTQTDDVTPSQISISDVIERLRSLVLGKYDGIGWETEDDGDWLSEELNVENEEFTNTALKFVALFESVVRYYAIFPETETVLNQYRSVLNAIQLPDVVTKVDDHRETFEEVATLTTRLEDENKYLLDAVTFVEDIVASRTNTELIRFQTMIQSWRGQLDTDETDVIDRICEEYDIVPAKFVPGELFASWKELIVKSFESLASANVSGEIVTSEGVLKIFETLKKKMHKLICDMHDAYKAEDKLNPVAFFEQIEEINHLVEGAVKVARGADVKGSKIETVVQEQQLEEVHHDHGHHDEHQHHDHDHHHHHHDPELDRHGHEHTHEDHEHHAGELHDHHEEQRDTAGELRLLLTESNKKIDRLVKELMEVKNSREYNEVQQLHKKLDETLYQLHLRDVHVVELTRELTQVNFSVFKYSNFN